MVKFFIRETSTVPAAPRDLSNDCPDFVRPNMVKRFAMQTAQFERMPEMAAKFFEIWNEEDGFVFCTHIATDFMGQSIYSTDVDIGSDDVVPEDAMEMNREDMVEIWGEDTVAEIEANS